MTRASSRVWTIFNAWLRRYSAREISASAALGLAYVAAGRMDVMLHRQANPWDYGAGVLLVREAGGSVSGMDGAPWVPADASVAAAATEAPSREPA